MDIDLSLYEARVIGSLIEKQITTPDQYPLSLNALTLACNQKSNRDPVLELDEAAVLDTVEGLKKKRLVTEKSSFGSRVSKYQHRFCNTEFGTLKFSERELGVICVLLLRGPQTPGELRTRTNRLCRFTDVQEVEATLEGMMKRQDGPFVARLEREPGRREHRYAHLFSGEVQTTAPWPVDMAAPSGGTAQRLDELESRVEALSREVAELRELLDELYRG